MNKKDRMIGFTLRAWLRKPGNGNRMICLNRFIIVVGLCAAGFVALAFAADNPSNINPDPVMEQGLTMTADADAAEDETIFSPEQRFAGLMDWLQPQIPAAPVPQPATQSQGSKWKKSTECK